MKSKSLKTKIMTAMLTGGILLSSVSLTFAATGKSLNTDKVGFSDLGARGNRSGNGALRNNFKTSKGNLEAVLKLGVSSNIITQAESDKVLEYQNSKIQTTDKTEKSIAEKPDFFKEIVDKGILTQSKVDALKANAQTQMETKRQQDLETNLAKYVTDKTITQEQANKIKAVIIEKQTTMKAEFEKIKAMSEEERKTYITNNKTNHINPLQALVDNGTITQAQADKIGFGGRGFDKHNRSDWHMKGLKVN